MAGLTTTIVFAHKRIAIAMNNDAVRIADDLPAFCREIIKALEK